MNNFAMDFQRVELKTVRLLMELDVLLAKSPRVKHCCFNCGRYWSQDHDNCHGKNPELSPKEDGCNDFRVSMQALPGKYLMGESCL